MRKILLIGTVLVLPMNAMAQTAQTAAEKAAQTAAETAAQTAQSLAEGVAELATLFVEGSGILIGAYMGNRAYGEQWFRAQQP